MADVQCTTSVQADPGQPLTPADVVTWVVDLPPDATLTPILREHGGQRDPVTVLVGLRAEWLEARR